MTSEERAAIKQFVDYASALQTIVCRTPRIDWNFHPELEHVNKSLRDVAQGLWFAIPNLKMLLKDDLK